jgi:membrane dipeptidase
MSEHIAYMAEKAGADHVGLGLDFMYLEGSDYGFYHSNPGTWPKGYPTPPWNFFQPEQMEDLVAALERRGFTNNEIIGILGANYLAQLKP